MNVEKKVYSILNTLGADCNFLGTKCIVELVLYFRENPTLDSIEKFYPFLCFKFGRTHSQIKRAIDFVIYKIDSYRIDLYYELFEQKPTILEMVNRIIELL